ncbi:murein L,D-transpeptidase catalytic domain family protein [Coxiella endosymbiont of Ornithodoros maritimus]|uniref:murein L,D-transpeptidase catalytic domain family protein n=1 Tax=Coxiella endosymbiont of Ornithodoros maritimus TaxID=1656172 RepID=UPI00226461F6|nr:murein L,D-transpeptidase catalytic domain family protein [Coxiella endosymbiont of Ornithodoros maritimus]
MGSSLIALITSIFLAISLASLSAKAFDYSDFQPLINKGLSPQALQVGIKAYRWARAHGVVKKPIMTLIDFKQPSNKKRLWVIDMRNGKLLFNGYVAQGKGSGNLYATRFSNKGGSDASSIGAMVTGESYYGHHGLSVRIYGLEKGVNNNLFKRALVFHSTWYATKSFAEKVGRLGRSWGCFAIDPKYSKYVFSKIKGGSFVFAYAPQEKNDPNFS